MSVLVQGAGDDGYLNTDEARLASLQDALKCGTNCGSCIPELKRKVRAARGSMAPGVSLPERSVIPIRALT